MEDNYEHSQLDLVYTVTSCPGAGIDRELYDEQLAGCKCTGTCNRDCSCARSTGLIYEDGRLLDSKRDGALFECNDECRCSNDCPSRLVQKGPQPGLKITEVLRKGLGVLTSKKILKGSFVCEYAGEIIGIEEARQRFSQQKKSDSNYILIMREHTDRLKQPLITIIDPTVIGNLGRYINHSCSPNLEVVPIRVNSPVPLAALFAHRDIAIGEELSYSYGQVQVDKSNNSKEELLKKCLCGALNCSGVLPSETEAI